MKLDRFEKGIVEELAKQLGKTVAEANQIVTYYKPVLDQLGRHDSPKEYASYLVLAHNQNRTLEEWLEWIDMINQAEGSTQKMFKQRVRESTKE